MSCTSAVTVNPSTVTENQPVTVTVTITNGGSTALNVVSIQPTAIFTGGSQNGTIPGNFGSVPIGTGLNVSVPGSSGTLAVPIGFVPFVGTTLADGTGSGTITLGATVTMSDGSQHNASTTTLTVNSRMASYPASEKTSNQPVSYP